MKKKKTPVIKKRKKDRYGSPYTRSTRQIKAQEYMSPKNIIIKTSLIH
jgi:hypothetical protein